MAFKVLDRILKIEKGKGITAVKKVRQDEEYFQDHFAGFPVLPGVLMLQGLVEASTFYVHTTEGFRNSQVYMTHCSQTKYSKLVRPGAEIHFELECLEVEGSDYDFKGKVREEGRVVALARFRMRSAPIEDTLPLLSDLETVISEKNRKAYAKLTGS